jgi:hypothetical protein
LRSSETTPASPCHCRRPRLLHVTSSCLLLLLLPLLLDLRLLPAWVTASRHPRLLLLALLLLLLLLLLVVRQRTGVPCCCNLCVACDASPLFLIPLLCNQPAVDFLRL